MSSSAEPRRRTALFVAVIVALLGACNRPAPAATDQVAANGFTLASTAVSLPPDDAQFPAGPGVATVDANCLACHSASMVLTQPPLSPEQWQAEVKKMRDVFRAPVAPADDRTIVGYLNWTSARLRQRGGAGR